MDTWDLTQGQGRYRVRLSARRMGPDLIVIIDNEMAHLGAVALGEYDHENTRASVSVITQLGHKEDAVARQAAYAIAKATRHPACVIAGMHLDGITAEEIETLLENSRLAVAAFIRRLERPQPASG